MKEKSSRYAASCPSGAANMIADGNLYVDVSAAASWSASGSAPTSILDTDRTGKEEDRGDNVKEGKSRNTKHSRGARSAKIPRKGYAQKLSA